MDRSLIPESDIFRVLGIGVAVIAKMSTSARSARILSFCLTPKRCSSSMITKPRFLKINSGPSSLCVPITISSFPDLHSSATIALSLFEFILLTLAMDTGQFAKRFLNVSKCCCARSVVGTSTAICFRFWTATSAARSATSVFPNPTSPQINLSVAFSELRSFSVSATVSA